MNLKLLILRTGNVLHQSCLPMVVAIYKEKFAILKPSSRISKSDLRMFCKGWSIHITAVTIQESQIVYWPKHLIDFLVCCRKYDAHIALSIILLPPPRMFSSVVCLFVSRITLKSTEPISFTFCGGVGLWGVDQNQVFIFSNMVR